MTFLSHVAAGLSMPMTFAVPSKRKLPRDRVHSDSRSCPPCQILSAVASETQHVQDCDKCFPFLFFLASLWTECSRERSISEARPLPSVSWCHFRSEYTNYFYHKLLESQMTRCQGIQNWSARAVVRTRNSTPVRPLPSYALFTGST